jgi:hypothetical protein
MNSQKGVLRPQIITPAQFIKQMKASQADMPPELSNPNQEQFIRKSKTVKNKPSTYTTQHHPTGHAIPQRWITCRRPPRSSIGQNITVHHHAHAAHSATATHRTGRPHQPESQVQPTHTPMKTDNKATRFSNTTTTANWDAAQL